MIYSRRKTNEKKKLLYMTYIILTFACIKIITVESAYFDVIRIKKGLQIIRNSNYQNTQRKRVKKMWMTDQEYRTNEQGGGGGPNPFFSCSLIADFCL